MRVFTERVGGGFGGKQGMLTEDLCVLAALKTGRPVKWEFTREEQFIGATTRHQMTAKVRLGARCDGTLSAIEVRVVSNTGAYCAFGARQRHRRAAGAGLRRNLVPRQTGPGSGIPRLGAAHRDGPGTVTRLPRLPVRAADSGVQDDWLAIPRFDTESNLQTWLDSPERKKLLEETASFLEEFHARVVRTGFEQWFPSAVDGVSPPAAWKQNMIVLLLLYPVVFLFGGWVQTPILMGKAGLPFWLALFIGNVVSVLLLNWLVPRVSNSFGWWLAPTRGADRWTSLSGAALILLLYAAWLLLFSKLS